MQQVILLLVLSCVLKAIANPITTCTTVFLESGTCMPFKQCYPYLYIDGTQQTAFSSQLKEDILEASKLCGSISESGNNRTTEDVICCADANENFGDDDVIAIHTPAEVEDEEGKTETLSSQFNNPWGTGGIHVVEPPFNLRPKFPTLPIKVQTTIRPPGIKPTKSPSGIKNPPPTPSPPPSSGSGEKESVCFQKYIVVPPGMQPHPSQHSYPFMASIVNGRRQHFCGGSLIDKSHVLTAAHCLNDYKSSTALQTLTVYLGAHDLSVPESSRSKHRVSSAFIHKGFNMKQLRDDIAILKLSKPVDSSRFVQPICISQAQATADTDTAATVAGWGQTCFKHCPTSVKLRHAPLNVLSNANCQSQYSSYQAQDPSFPSISSGMVCAQKAGYNVCLGDSGGPLFAKSDEVYRQIGVVSWGIDCGRTPGVFTRVSQYHSWIMKNIKS